MHEPTVTWMPAPPLSDSDLGAGVQFLKGVGPKMARLLEKVGVRTVEDLVFYFPRAYQDRSRARPLSMVVDGEPVLVVVEVRGAESFRTRSGKLLTKVAVADRSGHASLVFFNARFSLQSQFEKLIGCTLAVYGSPSRDRLSLQFTSPEWEVVETEAEAERILPVYPLTEGLSQSFARRIAGEVVERYADLVPERLPEALRDRLDLVDVGLAIRAVHFPPDDVTLQASRRRLIFEELFLLQLAIAQRHRQMAALPGLQMPESAAHAGSFVASLPWPLTGGQRRALDQVLADMASGRVMNRLVQGDVGSGKTAVAAAAMAAAVGHGYQAALMAPTEILAEQHFRVLYPLLKPAGLEPTLLTGSLPNNEKARIYEGAAAGSLPVLVGTHALLQETVAFQSLGMIVVDEQHRFGVEQRAILRDDRLRVALRAREREGKRAHQRIREGMAVGEPRRVLRAALAIGDAHRELLREELVELEPAPCRMRALLQALRVDVGRRAMEQQDAFAERREAERREARFVQRVLERERVERMPDLLAQRRLREPGGGGIDGRERFRQRRALGDDAVARMHHLVAEESRPHLAEEPHALSGGELLHLARVEVQEPDPQLALAVGELHHQRAPSAVLHLRVHHRRLDQHRLSRARIGERGEPRLVLVAQRQVECQVQLRADAELLEARVEGGLRSSLCGPGGGAVAGAGGDLHAPGADPRSMMASISTSAPRGSEATPTATRAG